MAQAPRELPLSTRRKVLVAIGAAMFLAQIAAAALLAAPTTGVGDANAGVLAGMWCGALAWSAVAVLLLARQANLPDIATASMLVTIAPFATFALAAAIDARGTDAEVNLVDTLFLGVTIGALTSLLVWAIAMAIARVLHLPAEPPQQDVS
jgi:hypothetical protein